MSASKLAAILAASLFLVLLSSCKVWKKLTKESTESHYYHDSTVVHTKESFTPVFIPGDSTKSTFNLEELLRSGQLKSTDRHFTTEIRYLDGNLHVNTTMDSLMLLLRKHEQMIQSMKTQQTHKKDVVVQEHKKSSMNWFWVALVLGAVLCVVVFLKIRWPFA